MKDKLTVLILTYNESIHIKRAIEKCSDLGCKIVVLDSYSSDDTCAIAQQCGAEVFYRKFDNYKNQREAAIAYVKDRTEWILFLDADEYTSNELNIAIKSAIEDITVQGYYFSRRFIFMKRWIKWGGYYPIYLMRLFRPEFASVNREVNEHIVITGNTKYLKGDLIHEDLKGISCWVDKHNKYASLEAKEFYINKHTNKLSNQVRGFQNQSDRKDWVRRNIWNKLPIVFFRPFLYFSYRYFVRLGFLDGKAGFIFHFLQAFWFWMLTDLKYLELKESNKNV